MANEITQINGYYVKDVVSAKGASILDIYPVGAIYFSAVAINPSTLFGGTWEQIKDRFLLAAGDSYAGGSIGGEATHTLTIDEMPAHSHSYKRYGGLTYFGDGGNKNVFAWPSDQNTESTGGSQPHNNMPPYLTVYVYKRTA